MKLEKGVQIFTTGVPNRDYNFSYHHPTRSFKKADTFTYSDSPTVIAYLVLSGRKFHNQYAFKNKDGTYRTNDSTSLTREELKEIHKDSSMMKSIADLIHNRPMSRNRLVQVASEKLHIDSDIVRANLPYLMINGVIGFYDIDQRLTSNPSKFSPHVFDRAIPKYHDKDMPGNGGKKKNKRDREELFI